VVVEGIDGAGKTTQARRLVDRLTAHGREAVYVKEPTDGPWGRRIREIAQRGREGITIEEELSWFIRDRAQDVEERIGPALNQGKVVVADRYYHSNIAYQSSLGIDPDRIRALNQDFPRPDIVFLIEASVSLGRRRINEGRGEEANQGYEQAAFLEKVQAAFDRMTDANIFRVDGSLSADQVAEILWERTLASIALPAADG
jgi:dTMP kinase